MSDTALGLLSGLVATVGIWYTWKFLSQGAKPGEPLSLRTVITGVDNRLSLSKLQAFVWFMVIFFGYVAVYAVRVRHGEVAALGELPQNLLWLLSFSAGGALGAKWLTAYRVRAGLLKKQSAAAPAARDLIADDQGYSAWNKLQLFYFTVLALAIYGIGLVQELNQAFVDRPPNLPNVDTTLLVLMGVSQATHLGKKAVTT